jgi:putative FmdB family regulatory protein
MPTYDFKCSECNHRFTVMVPIKEREMVTCPKCNSKVEQLFTWGGSFNVNGCSTSSKGASRGRFS